MTNGFMHNNFIKAPLTGKQRRVLETIELYVRAKGEPPTLDELRESLGFKSLRTVTQYLEALERKGYLLRRKHAHRNIELRTLGENGGAATLVSVPVVANVGCDDLSLFAQEERDEFLHVDKEIAGEVLCIIPADVAQTPEVVPISDEEWR
jgi:repressor LexA